jgi:hypothetical protein
MELLDSDSSEIYGVVKVRHEATSSMFWEEPSSASKIFKIAHHQKRELLLSNCYCLTFPPISNYI